jgi:hypothetical protein
MKKTLLIIERIVIEALENKELFLREVREQTGLDESLLKAVLGSLIEQGILSYNKGLYELDWKNKERWLSRLQNKESMKAEIKELFSSLVNNHFLGGGKSSLKVKKVWLEPLEREELERRLLEIDQFIDSIRNRRKVRPVKEVTKGKQVLFYGHSAYKELVDGVLKVS